MIGNHCAVTAIPINRTGPVTLLQCRSGKHAFWEVSWNIERFLFTDQGEAGDFYEVLAARYLRRQRSCAGGRARK